MNRNQSIRTIILVGNLDFGRCPLTSKLPTALWPVMGKPALENLLTSLAEQNIKKVTICSNGIRTLLEKSICPDNRLELTYLDEFLPVGTAGCIRDAIADEMDTLYIVFPAGIICPPNIEALIQAHRSGRSDLTVMCNSTNTKPYREPSGIYICQSGILEHIPEAGYYDIKEGLIPEMLRAGKSVHAAMLPEHVGNFQDRRQYLSGVNAYLESRPKLNFDLKTDCNADSQDVWIAANADVNTQARIYGPVVIMNGASISGNVVIIGPSVIGKNVTIGNDSIVVNSVIWDDAKIGSNCRIRECVIDQNTALRANTFIEQQSILYKHKGTLKSLADRVVTVTGDKISEYKHGLISINDKINKKLSAGSQSRRINLVHWLAGGLILTAFLWCYKSDFGDLWNLWQRSDEYSSGLLVPFLAGYILWTRHEDIIKCKIKPALWGLFAFLMAQLIRVFGMFFMFSSAERLSIMLTIAALVLLLFGFQFLRKVFTIILFLCLMLPWPNRIQTAVTLPLQRWATSSAVFCLEMVGYDVVKEGNVIHIGDIRVAVAEACNGLRMITAFFVISGLVVLLVKRDWWEKLIILISSLPIALVCNTIRLTVTAIFFTILEGEYWEQLFHDFGGYAMMPLALAAIIAELWFMKKLTTLPIEEEPVIITRQTD